MLVGNVEGFIAEFQRNRIVGARKVLEDRTFYLHFLFKGEKSNRNKLSLKGDFSGYLLGPK